MSRRNAEAFFRAQRIPFVDVTAAQRALVPDSRFGSESSDPALRDFEFVIYGSTGENWLVKMGKRTPEQIESLRAWAVLFGEPFKPVFLTFRTHPEFSDIDGKPLDWQRQILNEIPNDGRRAKIMEDLTGENPHFDELEHMMGEAADRGDAEAEDRLCDCAQAVVASAARALPLELERHQNFKREHPDAVILFRIGDFYETFAEDAELVGKALGLTVTTTRAGIKMAGVPYHQLETYLRRMIALGMRVAICEQTKKPPAHHVARVATPPSLGGPTTGVQIGLFS